jgi:2,3-bisphosphoglycerate-independent phosphoglycerate mutase
MTKKTALLILDGWGYGDGSLSDATTQANTPFFDQLRTQWPSATLRTSGEDVGLPEGQMGNSEVGHLNIGAGRVVYQELAKINKACREKTIDTNPELLRLIDYVKTTGKKLHLMGLISDGGVHSSQEHVHHLLGVFHAAGLEHVFIHAFTDGRDTDPRSGRGFLQKLETRLSQTTGKIASITGRYYAMDRDKRWERVKIAYDALVSGVGKPIKNIQQAMEEVYDAAVTDEFIEPLIVCDDAGNPLAKIEEDDAVFCFNFRTDRCREITTVLTQKDMPEHGMKTMRLHYVTMTNYDQTYKGVHVLYEEDDLQKTLGEVIARAGKKQIRIAETEKYPHVTHFFSGRREQPFEGEQRIMIPSPKVSTYDLQPEMSARELTAAILPELEKQSADFICLNFANPDMVGHTGVFKAVVRALETVDACLKQIVETGLRNGYSFIIIADHGNADYMINPDGSPNTAHTTNLVPCILIDDEYKYVRDGRLADVAPTILKLMGMEQPSEMTGTALCF